MSFWHVYLGIYGGGGTPPSSGEAGDFTIALVPNGACGGDPPDTNDENGACYRGEFGALELRGGAFGPIELLGACFGELELQGGVFGVMRTSRA